MVALAGCYFDQAAADRACDFFPLFLKHTKGSHAGKPFELLPWQRHVTSQMFGWKRPDGSRRYRTAYVEIPRKNGKTEIAAGWALYLLLADEEPGAEVYSAAYTRDQASLVFNAAETMARADEDLSEMVDFLPSFKRLNVAGSNGFYRAISADAKNAHGFNASGIVFDELHTQRNRELWDVLTTSTGARRQPLTIAITTAGHDRSSICYELHSKALRILEGTEVDDSFLPVVYAAEEGDDWTAPETWIKANPSVGQAVSLEYLAEQCDEAKKNPAKENTFKNLHLNIWTEQQTRWLQMELFRRGSTLETPPPGVWHGAIDIGATRDVCAFAACMFDGTHYWARFKFWAPIKSIDDRAHRDRQQVRNWISQGWIIGTEGTATDFARVRADVLTMHKELNLQTLAFDPWQAADFTQTLAAQGFPKKRLVRFPQTISQFALPCARLEEIICEGVWRYEANPCIEWMAGNTAIWEDGSGNKRPDKGRSADKIDGVVALLMALREVVAPSTKSAAKPAVH